MRTSYKIRSHNKKDKLYNIKTLISTSECPFCGGPIPEDLFIVVNFDTIE